MFTENTSFKISVSLVWNSLVIDFCESERIVLYKNVVWWWATGEQLPFFNHLLAYHMRQLLFVYILKACDHGNQVKKLYISVDLWHKKWFSARHLLMTKRAREGKTQKK